jgi:signal transduction histidine kinase
MSSTGEGTTSTELLRQTKRGDGVGPFDDISSPVLRTAAQRVAAFASGAGEADCSAELGAIVRCLELDDQARLEALKRYDFASCMQCLDRLRVEVIRNWTKEQPFATAADVLPLMEAFDRVRLWLDSHIEVAGQHVPPTGMNLAVEIAHDLRSPLTSILFLSETVRRGQSGEINELQHRQLGLIYAAALGMVSLASNLIELAQTDDRLLEQHPAPFSVTESLESICDIIRPIAEEKKLALRVLPPSVDHRIGFSAALSRVLLNLLTNALQNTEDGFVEIAVRPKGVNLLEFSVRDTGVGLSDEARQALFDPFRRVRKGSRYGFSGSGLGLAICRRLLKAMRSELQYETAAGWGTRFYFDLELPPANL